MSLYSKEVIELALRQIQKPRVSKLWGICNNYLWDTHKISDDLEACSEVAELLKYVMIDACKRIGCFSECEAYPILPLSMHSLKGVNTCRKAEKLFDSYSGGNKWDKSTEYGRTRCQVYNLMVKLVKRMYLAAI